MDATTQKEEVEYLRNKWQEEIEITDADTDYISGKLSISPILSPDFKIKCNDQNKEVAHVMIRVNALPPIELLFQFNSGYPSREMPSYQISCLWLSYDQMRILCRQLNRLYQNNSGSAIMDLWGSFLQEEAMASLGIQDLLDLTDDQDCDSPEKKKMRLILRPNKGYGRHRILVIKLGMPLSDYIIKYNKNKRLKQFLSRRHTCAKCNKVNLASRTLVFKYCRHEFCFECMTLMASTVKPLINIFYICPVTDCEKTISKSKVWAFIKDVLANKAYEMKELRATPNKTGPNKAEPNKTGSNKEKKEAEEKETKPSKIVVCPCCSSAVPVYSISDTLGICSICTNIFCYLCNKTYHGILPCHIAIEDKVKVFLAYTSANEAEKSELINKYGVQRLTRLVEQLGETESSKMEVEDVATSSQ